MITFYLGMLISLPILGLAVYRISRLLIEDKLLERPRNWLWKHFPPESTMIGYFFTCYWCTSIWTATIVVICYTLFPVVTIIVAMVFAISAAVGLIDHFRQR